MNFFRKIKWHRGMEITPGTFEAVDRYNESMVESARKLAVIGSYGLMPSSDKNFHTTIIDGMVSVQVYFLEAVTRSGRLFQISGDAISLKQPHARGRECYVVVHADGDIEQEINNVVFSKPRFAYDYCSLDEIGVDSLPIAKLTMDSGIWHMQELYIPPCVSVGAHPELMSIVTNSDKMLKTIISKLENRQANLDLQYLRLLSIELEDYDGSESPKTFCLLLKKIVSLLYALNIKGVSLPDRAEIVPFNNDDVLLCVSKMIVYMRDFENAVSAIVEEKPTAVKHEDKVIWDITLR